MKTKRILVVLLLATCLLLSLPLAALAEPAAAPAASGTKVVTAQAGLKLRSGPGLGYGVITVLSYGQPVTPISGPVWGDGISWTYVKVHRGGYWYEGYCATTYLGYGGGHPPAPGGHGLQVTAAAGLRLRSGPGTGYAVWRVVPYGTILRPTGAQRWGNGLLWSQVVIGGSYLWGASAYLRPV